MLGVGGPDSALRLESTEFLLEPEFGAGAGAGDFRRGETGQCGEETLSRLLVEGGLFGVRRYLEGSLEFGAA